MILCSIMMCVAFVDCFFIRFYHVDILTSGYKKAGPGRRSSQPAGTSTRKLLSQKTSPEPRLVPTRSCLKSKLILTAKRKTRGVRRGSREEWNLSCGADIGHDPLYKIEVIFLLKL